MPGTTSDVLTLSSNRPSRWLLLLPIVMMTVTMHPVLAATLGAGVLGAGMLGGGMPWIQKHESRHEIDHLEEAWRDAVLKQDTIAMGVLLADDYMAISAYGTLQTKEQALTSLRTGKFRLTTLDISDRKVRFYGTTALVTSFAAVKGTSEEGDISGNYRYTRVYVRDERGEWKIVSFEASRVRESGEHR